MTCTRLRVPDVTRGWADVRLVAGRLDEQPSGTVDALLAHARAGGAVLVLPEPGDAGAEALAGALAVGERPRAEWFVVPAPGPEAARLPAEVAVTTHLHVLAATTARPAARVTIALEHPPVLTVREVGAGRVVACGVTDLDALLAHDDLRRLVRRLLTGAEAPARPLGLAVVGYGPFGGMGYTHGLAATEVDGLAFTAAVDPAPNRLDVAARDFPDLHLYDRAEALESDDAVDVAVIATPPVHHAGLAVRLLEAGKHVVVEKPMCLTRADADRMLDAARASGRVLTVHQSRRWDADVLALRQAVQAGLLGEVFNVEVFVGGFAHPCRAWHSETEVSGGAVYDWGSHHLDAVIGLYGSPPVHVSAHAHKRVWHDVTNADQVTVWLRWADGREATFRQSDVAGLRRPKLYVQGTEGTAEGWYRPVRTETIEPGRGYAEQVSHHAEAPVELTLARYEGGRLVEQRIPPATVAPWPFHRNLADHLLLGEPLAVPPQQSRTVVAVLEAAQRAGASGSVDADLEDLSW